MGQPGQQFFSKRHSSVGSEFPELKDIMEAFIRSLNLEEDTRYKIHQTSYSLSQALNRKFKYGLPRTLRESHPIICVHLAFIKEKKSSTFPQDLAIKRSSLKSVKSYFSALGLAQNLLDIQSDIDVLALSEEFNCSNMKMSVDSLINDYKSRVISSLSSMERKFIKFGSDLPVAAFFLIAQKNHTRIGIKKLLNLGRVDRSKFDLKCQELKRMFPDRLVGNKKVKGVKKVKKRLKKYSLSGTKKKVNMSITKSTKTKSSKKRLSNRKSFRNFLSGRIQKIGEKKETYKL